MCLESRENPFLSCILSKILYPSRVEMNGRPRMKLYRIEEVEAKACTKCKLYEQEKENFNWYITRLNVLLFTCASTGMICRFATTFIRSSNACNGPILFTFPIRSVSVWCIKVRISCSIMEMKLWYVYVHTIKALVYMRWLNMLIAFKTHRTV